ncbi:MAG: lipase chaperone [Pseudomonadales bacterium]|jgi:lipase chaperone LimK|uniref:lipase secretion chaperone n=1 Tax=unclassified Ketobacter TaxID=2639109 RepID=UPI000C91EF83|nr:MULTISPECIES: lipase secretion chaperone [unclassified Ketobacter]MAQ23437.1 lipase chaperone [Pseudomonadales bacterium]MEC8813415.1 lipase secretion chaperone [Pseudomonadota bacterium]TNC87965.1 MAG: lipase chaperone [Alcanivorax sp.]HCB40578.1 lipase chaperone [Gammaproteobacteria bacterium]RLT90515.1 MAG: lipase chaperone [Ketobacter sp. GenoA1]|tara:strand:- start:7328 stop:8428 length:1101 start_codon:yes stop_codon:yes gene_type:complete
MLSRGFSYNRVALGLLLAVGLWVTLLLNLDRTPTAPVLPSTPVVLPEGAAGSVDEAHGAGPAFEAEFEAEFEPVFKSGLERLPASLRGTQPDGALLWDQHNELVITHSIRDLFDYFLAASGEEPLASLTARIRAYIQANLPQPAASQALAVLQDYLAMKTALSAMAAPDYPMQQAMGNTIGDDDLQALRQHMQALITLRNSYLTPEVAEVFYGEADEFDRYMLDRLAVLQHQDLGAEEKSIQLERLQDSLSPELRQSQLAQQELITLSRLSRQLRLAGASDAALQQLRRQRVGAEAAARLQSLDQQRARWQQRMAQWLQERSRLLAANGLSLQDREQQVLQHRRQHFSSQEIRRVQALESLHDQRN